MGGSILQRGKAAWPSLPSCKTMELVERKWLNSCLVPCQVKWLCCEETAREWGLWRAIWAGREFPGWSLHEEQLTFMSRLCLPCFFLSSQPSLGVHTHPAVNASALNSLVAEETIRAPKSGQMKCSLLLQLP